MPEHSEFHEGSGNVFADLGLENSLVGVGLVIANQCFKAIAKLGDENIFR